MDKTASTRPEASPWMPTGGTAAKIALSYFGLSCLWILGSGWLLHHLVHDETLAAWIEIIKGWFFVSVTAWLLGLVLHRYLREIRRVVSRLQDDQTRLRLIGDNLPGSYVYQYIRTLDGQPQFTHVSAGVERVHGLKPAELLRDARSLFAQMEPDQQTAYAAAEAESARHLTDFQMELSLRHPDGSRRQLQLQSRPRRDPEGRIQWDGFATDITDRKQAENLLREREDQLRLFVEHIRELNRTLDQRVHERTAELRASNEELDAFAHAVSHDLRAPLRAMNGFSQALLEDFGPQLPQTARDYVGLIQSSSRQMDELIHGLLRLSRSVRGSLHRDTVDVSRLATRILNDLQKNEPRPAVRWTVQPGLVANGDERLLEVVLTNLLGNAWKYTAHTPEPLIQVRGQAATFVVADNGAGFDMKHAARLFQPFQRLHREDEFPGLGIGLATVQRIIRRHGGEISAQAAPGAGATFSFTLPPFESHDPKALVQDPPAGGGPAGG